MSPSSFSRCLPHDSDICRSGGALVYDARVADEAVLVVTASLPDTSEERERVHRVFTGVR